MENRSMIFKVELTEDGPSKDMVSNTGLFQTEISMIMDTLKKMDAILNHEFPFNAKGFYSQDENPAFIAMEDLCSQGYKMANRLMGFDLEHCILAIQGLARFHATSIFLAERENNIKTLYSKGMFNHEFEYTAPQLVDLFIKNTKSLAEVISTWPEAGERYTDKISKISDKIYKLGIKSSEPNENGFNVITHGDFWVNNMMFQYDDSGVPKTHIMMDFQYCKYTSPVLDLLFFINTSLSNEVFDNHQKLLLQEYHESLCKTMEKIGCKTVPLSLEKLIEDYEKRAVFGMIVTLVILPMVLVEKPEVLCLHEFSSRDLRADPGLKNPRCRTILAKRLKEYDKIGLLDL